MISILLAAAAAQTVGGGWEASFSLPEPIRDDARLGASLAPIRDLDADGRVDYLISKPGRPELGVIGEVAVYSSSDGALIRSFMAPAGFGLEFGAAVAPMDDLDGDGLDDILIGDPHANRVWVYSSQGGLINEIVAPTGSYRFGASLAYLGDTDGDGLLSLVVGDPSARPNGVSDAGAVYLFKIGIDEPLGEWVGRTALGYFGASIAALGDLDGGGAIDFAVGATGEGSVVRAGRVWVWAGEDGRRLGRWEGEDFEGLIGGNFGARLASAGDVDGDGVEDVMVGSPRLSQAGQNWGGTVHVLSSKTREVLFQLHGDQSFEYFGESIASAGDLDQDGHSEFLIGAPGSLAMGVEGRAYLHSGADGSVIEEFAPSGPSKRFGESVLHVQSSQNGFGQVVVGDPVDRGGVTVFGYEPYLTATSETYSVAAGDAVRFYLKFPQEAAGWEYRLLISASGTGPSFLGVPIPLGFDAIGRWSWEGSDPRLRNGRFHGTLDANAQADAVLWPAQGAWGAYLGSYHLAAVAMLPGEMPQISSVAIPLSIVP